MPHIRSCHHRAMSRFAIGDLMIDVEVPAHFECDYTVTGALVAADRARDATVEISALTIDPKDPSTLDAGARYVMERAASKGAAHEIRGSVVLARDDGSCLSGIGNKVVIATLTCPESHRPALEAELREIVGGVDAAHDSFPVPGDKLAFRALRPSHALWFRQTREGLRATVGWKGSGLIPLDRLDAFWGSFVQAPPDDASLLNRILNGIAVELGDHLVTRGFEWCICRDPWGTALAVVALPETAKMVIVPESFVTKRWDNKEPRFLEDGVRAICEQVAGMKKEWGLPS